MNEANSPNEVALIVGGGPGISASCADFADEGMRVAVAARNPDKPVLEKLEQTHRVRRYACDNIDPDHIAQTYLQLHRQHRSTWAFEVVLRPWVEKW